MRNLSKVLTETAANVMMNIDGGFILSNDDLSKQECF